MKNLLQYSLIKGKGTMANIIHQLATDNPRRVEELEDPTPRWRRQRFYRHQTSNMGALCPNPWQLRLDAYGQRLHVSQHLTGHPAQDTWKIACWHLTRTHGPLRGPFFWHAFNKGYQQQRLRTIRENLMHRWKRASKLARRQLGDEKGHCRGPNILTKGCGSRTTALSSRLTLTITSGCRDKVFHSSYQRGLHIPWTIQAFQSSN